MKLYRFSSFRHADTISGAGKGPSEMSSVTVTISQRNTYLIRPFWEGSLSKVPSRPILGLDTSVINRLTRAKDAKSILAAMLSGYTLRIPEMAVGEIMGTRAPGRRMNLLTTCRRLLQSGSCLLPAQSVLDLHIQGFHLNPSTYGWRKINIRSHAVEREIQSGDFVDDEASVEQLAAQMRRLQDEFEEWFKPGSLLSRRFDSFADWQRQSKSSGGSFWNTAGLLYEGAFGQTSAVDTQVAFHTPPTDATLASFIDVCPPVRALIYALELTLYDRIHRAENRQAFKAGRNDQMMAVYLPYCDQSRVQQTSP
jgi:hypothetical protein